MAAFLGEKVWAQTFSPDALSAPQKAAEAVGFKPVRRTENVQKTPEKTEETLEGLTQAFRKPQNDVSADDPLAQISKALATQTPAEEAEKTAEQPQDEEEVFIPEGELYRLNTPTLDNSVRGGQAFVEVDDKGRMKKVTKIFLYYDKFKIGHYMGGATSCDVRFNILSNLDRKINQLDVKLVWPDMTTTLSFSNVQPNTQTYYNYSLLGNGCYNMDKAPNIIVNRCRVKGMTAAECANKLVWLSK